jgi:hypothetical protein
MPVETPYFASDRYVISHRRPTVVSHLCIQSFIMTIEEGQKAVDEWIKEYGVK